MKSILQAFAGFELRLGCSGSTSIRISCFPLNLAYHKRCLSFLPAFQRVFRIQVKARAYTERKKLIVLCPCPSHLCFGQDGQDLGITLPKSQSFPSSRGRNPGFGCFEDCYQANLIVHPHGCQGFIPVPVKFASMTTGFCQFGVFHLSPQGT